MPESLVYLLFVLGVVLVISAVARHERLGEVEKPDGLSAGERLRLGLYRYRPGGFIIGVMVLLLVWFEVSSPSTLDDSQATGPVAQTREQEVIGQRIFESAYIEIKLPSDWTATD
ncbi:MAG: hypothetical protein CL696_11120 [Chloroflexi bacterium]|jgi:hypothetical protein|nr:hypothetical protein [Chloroflexota bacterium]MDP6498518.1 hypothetical protein [Dehalococcoidia bacterium]MQG55015.1 hypothetical protein [SAR202 cluster bacterium]|tara:strand:- start:405 stop:749 length:345 start_codon:yes stop_codon:yes gene_type:complete